ncbi:MAG: HepT-like ribonuclease domain-containing protein [Planctomycetota bacterium]|jgi:uncharacterized protein with HEPN domain
MRDHVREALDLVADKARVDFDRDRVFCLALTHLVQIIGEAARRVPAELRANAPDIPWQEIVGMRHKIVHDYIEVDDDVVWAVVTGGDLAELDAALGALLKGLPAGTVGEESDPSASEQQE